MERGTQQPNMADAGSLAPVQTHRLSVEAEASLMNRGRGRQIAGIAGGAVLLLVLGVVMLQHLGETQAYADAAAAAAGVEREHFEGYFMCALPGATSSQLTTGQRLQSLFERAGDRLGKGYAATLSSCAPRLQELQTQVAQLPVPDALASEHRALQDAVEQLTAATAGFQRYLDDGASPYDFAAAVALIEKLGLAFDAYRDADAALTAAAQQRM